jgi:hypothetical protein
MTTAPVALTAAKRSGSGSPKWKLTIRGRWHTISARCSVPKVWNGAEGTTGSSSPRSARIGARRSLTAADRASMSFGSGWQKKFQSSPRLLRRAKASTCSSIDVIELVPKPREPSAPAFDTSAASSGVAALAIGAWTIGSSIPSKSVNAFVGHISSWSFACLRHGHRSVPAFRVRPPGSPAPAPGVPASHPTLA